MKKFKRTASATDREKFSHIDKKIDLSQMSEFTAPSTMKGMEKNYATILKSLDNHKQLSSTMDREGLLKELIEYKKFAIYQHDEIKRYKVELAKVRKLAATSITQARKDAGLSPSKPTQRDSWVNKADACLMKPRDEISLKDELKALKLTLTDMQEKNKALQQKCARYEKRAKYAVEKFFEIKKKEMQLISFGEERVRSQMTADTQK